MKEEGKNFENLNLKGKLIKEKKVEKNLNYNDNKDKNLKGGSIEKKESNYYQKFKVNYMSEKKDKIKKYNYKTIHPKNYLANHKLNHEGGLLRQILMNKKEK